MLYQIRKILCYSLIISIFNLSFCPLYAVHTSPNPEDTSDKTAVRPRYLVLEDSLQRGIIKSANKVQVWTPQFIQRAVSQAYNQVCTYLSDMVKDIAPLVLTKTPQEAAFDPLFWLAEFNTSIKEMQENSYTSSEVQKEMEEFQDIVFSGMLSPYFYESKLDELRLNILSSSKKKKIREKFRNTLKEDSTLLNRQFQKDLLTSLNNLPRNKKGIKDFKNILMYYQNIQNVVDYVDTLAVLKVYVYQNKQIFQLDESKYKALDQAIDDALNNINPYEYIALKNERAMNQKRAKESERGSPEDEATNRSSLVFQEENKSFSYLQNLKSLSRIIGEVFSFVLKNPVHATVYGLLSQVVFTAAVKSFTPPNPQEIKSGGASNFPSIDEEKKFLNPGKRNVGVEIQINPNGTIATNPSPSFDFNGNPLVAYVGTTDGFARVINGTTQGFITNPIPFGEQGGQVSNPFPLLLPNGKQLIAYEGYAAKIKGITFNNNSLSPISYLGDQNHVYGNPSLTWANGTIAGAWFASPSYVIYGNVINQNLSSLFPTNVVLNAPTNGSYQNPVLGSFLDGGILAAYYGSQVSGNPNNVVFVRKFDSNFSPRSSETTLTNTGSNNGNPTFVVLPNNRFCAAWEFFGPGYHSIMGAIYDETLNVIVSPQVLSGSTPGNRRNPSVTYDNVQNRIHLVYQGDQNGNNDIYLSSFDENLSSLNSETMINVETSGDQLYPKIAFSPITGLFVTYQGNPTGTNNAYGLFPNTAFSTTSSMSPGTTENQAQQVPPPPESNPKSNTPAIAVGVTTGVVAPVVIVCAICGFKKCKRRHAKSSTSNNIELMENGIIKTEKPKNETNRTSQSPGIQAETIVGERGKHFQIVKVKDNKTAEILADITGVPFDPEKITAGAHGTVSPAVELDPQTGKFTGVVAAKIVKGERDISRSQHELTILEELRTDSKTPHTEGNDYTTWMADHYVYDPDKEKYATSKSILTRQFSEKTEIIITPWIAGGDGQDFIKRLSYLTNEEEKSLLLSSLVASIFRAVSYLNGRGIYHHDINPGNILLDMTTGYFRLTDFGSSSKSAHINKTVRVKGGYATPEFLAYLTNVATVAPPSTQGDGWSSAVVSWQFLFDGVNPFFNISYPKMEETIKQLNEDYKSHSTPLVLALLQVFQKRLPAAETLKLAPFAKKDQTTREWRVKILMNLIQKDLDRKKLYQQSSKTQFPSGNVLKTPPKIPSQTRQNKENSSSQDAFYFGEGSVNGSQSEIGVQNSNPDDYQT